MSCSCWCSRWRCWLTLSTMFIFFSSINCTLEVNHYLSMPLFNILLLVLSLAVTSYHSLPLFSLCCSCTICYFTRIVHEEHSDNGLLWEKFSYRAERERCAMYVSRFVQFKRPVTIKSLFLFVSVIQFTFHMIEAICSHLSRFLFACSQITLELIYTIILRISCAECGWIYCPLWCKQSVMHGKSWKSTVAKAQAGKRARNICQYSKSRMN